MATLTFTFVSRCSGGEHLVLDVAVNGGVNRRTTYQTDDIREPLSNLTLEQQDMLKLLILKVHMSGKTRPQIVAEFANPVVVTI